MFEKNDISPICPSAEELIAYIYGELGPEDRSSFESHLPDCERCAAELAELSFARLDVYEWHRDEFASLATPRIVVPYNEPVKASWFSALTAILASPVRLAAAGGAFAMVAVAVIWFAIPRPGDIAENVPVPAPATLEMQTIDTPSRPSALAKVPVAADVAKPAAEPTQAGQTRPNATVRKAKSRPVTVKTGKPRTPQGPVEAWRPQELPRLNDFDDFDDDSLRLGDLLAEIDTRE